MEYSDKPKYVVPILNELFKLHEFDELFKNKYSTEEQEKDAVAYVISQYLNEFNAITKRHVIDSLILFLDSSEEKVKSRIIENNHEAPFKNYLFSHGINIMPLNKIQFDNKINIDIKDGIFFRGLSPATQTYYKCELKDALKFIYEHK